MTINYDIIKNIPNVKKYCLHYIFEDLEYQHRPNTLWLEFGTFNGNTINYISKFTQDKVYGFDSFEGLPEKWRDGFPKGSFGRSGSLPKVNSNVELVKGWFDKTLENFLSHNREEISFLHLDADLYSSTKYVLDTLTKRDQISEGCIIVFDELVNFKGFYNESSELRALSEWLFENPNINYEWIGVNGEVYLDNRECAYDKQQACLRII